MELKRDPIHREEGKAMWYGNRVGTDGANSLGVLTASRSWDKQGASKSSVGTSVAQ